MGNRVKPSRGTWVWGLVVGAGALAAGAPDVRFANDLGAPTVDVSRYPSAMRERYAVFSRKCGSCHSLARPIHSQFLELSEAERAAGSPRGLRLDSVSHIWTIDSDIWRRYIKRMAAKPGSAIAPSEAKAIHEFLVYDGLARKWGARAEAWRKERSGLLEAFRRLDPRRYEELYGRPRGAEATLKGSPPRGNVGAGTAR